MLTLSITRSSRITRILRRALCAFSIASIGLVAASPGAAAQTCKPAWDTGFDLVLTPPPVSNPGPVNVPGPDGRVNAMVVFDDGSGPALYAGGFSGSSPDFVPATRIAKWDGSAWKQLDGEMNDIVASLAVFDDGTGPALYAGGSFTTVGGISARHIAKWDGQAWSALGSSLPIHSGLVFALTAFDDGTGPALYAGYQTISAGGVFDNGIAKWDGTHWSPLGDGVSGSGDRVLSLTVFDDGTGPALYAGGWFTTAGGAPANAIAKWDGVTWSPLGSGFSGTSSSSMVRALTVFDDGTGPALYAGGTFETAGGAPAKNIAKWDGQSWSPLGSGMIAFVSALTVFDDGMGSKLFAGGIIHTAGGVIANDIAQWDGAHWSSLGSGMGGFFSHVRMLTVFDDGAGLALYAGGSFTMAGGAIADRVAKWDGSAWAKRRGVGVDNSIEKLVVQDINGARTLFSIGDFSLLGQINSTSISSFDGQAWQSLDGGFTAGGTIDAMVVFNDGSGPAVYAAGTFTSVGGVATNNIAKWDGSTWSPLGSGVNKSVSALAVFDDGAGPALFASGFFTTAGGIPVNHIAKWDGLSWTPLGSGLGGPLPIVPALAVFDDGTGSALYAGGFFTTAGGAPVNHIAKWDGLSWTPLGSGLNIFALALDVIDDGTGPELWVRGTFTTAGGQAAARIAKWDGSSWDTLGGGLPGSPNIVNALAAFDDGTGPAIYVTGLFTSIGGVSANNIAKWNGASWSSLGPIGLNNEGKTLTVFDDGTGSALYVGGTFIEVDGLSANRIARWDGLSWSTLDFGIDNAVTSFAPSVNALAVFDGPTGPALYVGGNFAMSGGLPASNFARWNGCAVASPADLDGDGVVSGADLSILLGQWGPCPPPPSVCAADLNSDGVVNAADLASLLASWG